MSLAKLFCRDVIITDMFSTYSDIYMCYSYDYCILATTNHYFEQFFMIWFMDRCVQVQMHSQY